MESVLPLVSKWAGIILEVTRTNQSGSNESMSLEKAQNLFTERVGKRFDLDHWYEMLKGQPKWKTFHNPTANLRLGSSKKC